MSAGPDESAALTVLAALGAIPSAPLHEEGVAAYVTRFLHGLGLTPLVDNFGNIVAAYEKGGTDRPLALVAHLDHPGIEITAPGPGNQATAALL
ncbi:MAG TPA: hypothetical protein VFZ25_01030, partial [Chloroflexota bacterium]|nr:hypothetical protein [Chloroflexota bacterium]